MSGLNSVLTGLQNPTQPDLVGSFQEGRSEGLQGQILAETFGGKLGALGTADPKAAMELAEKLGIPKNNKERFDTYVGTMQAATALANGAGGAPAAIQLMQEHRDRLKQLDPNADTSRLDRQIEFLELEPEAGIEALNLTTASLIEQNFLKDPESDTKFSPSTKILEDGTTVQTTNNGQNIVTDKTGKRITGEAAAKAIEEAVNFGINAQGDRAQARVAGTSAVKRSEEAFDKVGLINTNILNLDEAIRLIDDGAETGPIMALLPSVRKSAVQLDNLQARLGLDVISNTTFGALSESELKFALDTALPKNLEGPALREWLVSKKLAQEKMSGYLTEVASFLGTKGNTTADWIELQKSRAVGRENNQMPVLAEGEQVFEDANGKRAIVKNGQVIREL